jgi:hypothetical protein
MRVFSKFCMRVVSEHATIKELFICKEYMHANGKN